MTEDEFIEITAESVRRINVNGPNGVMTEQDGVVDLKLAMKMGIRPTTIFIRDDGVSIASDEFMEINAYDLYKDNWVAFMRYPGTVAIPIELYDPPMVKEEDI